MGKCLTRKPDGRERVAEIVACALTVPELAWHIVPEECLMLFALGQLECCGLPIWTMPCHNDFKGSQDK